MKKTIVLVMTVIVSVALLVSATVWEGVTDVISAGDLPGGSFGIATNSFPRNTIVDITNLENGKMVRVKVVSGLETTGLLATLSRTAADSIDLRGNSTCRIRMTQPSDDIAFSHFRLGPIAPPSTPVSEANSAKDASAADNAPATGSAAVATAPPADNATRAKGAVAANNATAANNAPPADNAATANNAPAAKSAAVANNAPPAENATAANNAPPADNAATANNAPAAKSAAVANNAPPAKNATTTDNAVATNNAPPANNAAMANNASPSDSAAAAKSAAMANNAPPSGYTTAIKDPAAVAEKTSPETSIASGKLSLLPTEERPPAETMPFVIESENAANTTPSGYATAPALAPATAVAPAPQAETEKTKAVYIPPSDFSPFPVPLISSLEPNKWYVQVGVYTHPDYVEDEITRIGTTYPLAIQNVGTDTSPMFRVLLGPLNQGESGAMLQRFKSIGYNDAFVRHN